MLCIVINTVLILAIVFKKIRDRVAYEEDQRVLRMYHETVEMNKEIVKRVTGLNRTRNLNSGRTNATDKSLMQSSLLENIRVPMPLQMSPKNTPLKSPKAELLEK